MAKRSTASGSRTKRSAGKAAGIRAVGILTGGGDCPGLNAVIRAVTKTLIYERGIERVVGFLDGYAGLVENRFRELRADDVSGILTRGGTILGASNKANPFKYYPPEEGADPGHQSRDVSDACREHVRELGLDALVCIGGDGTMAIAGGLIEQLGLKIVGIPKTIDNDVLLTDFTFGFPTAVEIATEAIDRLHSTASSHHRVMIVEVMGRYAGWLALYAGVAGGADVILLPEIPYRLERVAETVEQRNRIGKKASIICVAEGARPRGGAMTVARRIADSPDPVRLGGVAHKLAAELEAAAGVECRATVLGYVQRGGTPSAMDRTLATQFGHAAAELVVSGRFGRMVALKNHRIVDVDMSRVAGRTKNVRPKTNQLVATARAVGTSFGD